jgi:hypothetical protein
MYVCNIYSLVSRNSSVVISLHTCMNKNYPEIRKTSMKWVILYFIGLFAFAQLLAGCNNPTEAMNLLTPDRLGIGTIDGTMDLTGKSSGWYDGHYDNGWGTHGFESGQTGADLKMEGSSNATMLWLEWDFPSWKEPNDYDQYLRDRIRTLNLEKDLMLKNKVITETIEKLDKALDREAIYHRGDCCEPTWPLKLTEQYGTGGA